MNALGRAAIALVLSMPATLLIVCAIAWALQRDEISFIDVTRILFSAYLAGPIVLGIVAAAIQPRIIPRMRRIGLSLETASVLTGLFVGSLSGAVMAAVVPQWILGFLASGLLFGALHGWIVARWKGGGLLEVKPPGI